MAEPLVASVPDAAVMLGQSEDTILRLLDRGLLPELPRWTRRRLIPLKAIHMVIEDSMAGFDPGQLLRELVSPS
jgi:hypothetical protein